MPYQMKNGKWRATRMIQGIVKTKTFTTKTEAKKWEAEQNVENWQKTATTPSICLLDLCTAYLQMATERFPKRTVNEKTLACKRALQVLSPTLPAEKITLQQSADILRRVARQSGNVANKTRKNLAAMWEFGKRYYGLPVVNPFKETDRFPADRQPRYVPPEQDFWKIYDLANDYDKVFLLFFLHTGARREEVFRLE